jgi:hypothetical protein
MKPLLIVSVLAFCVASPAWANLSGLNPNDDCQRSAGQLREVDHARIVDVLINRTAARMSFEDIRGGSLGRATIRAHDFCLQNPAACNAPQNAGRRSLSALYEEVATVFRMASPESPVSDPNFSVTSTIDVRALETNAAQRDRRVAEFLDGGARWLTVSCISEAGRDPASSSPSPTRSPFERWVSNVIVGRTNADATRSQLSKREFATFSITDDREADAQTTAIEAFIGFPLPYWAHPDHYSEIGFTPFLSWQRQHVETDAGLVTKDIDNLTFGLSSPIYFYERSGSNAGDLSFVVQTSVAWETDSEFDSSVGRVELAYVPYHNFPCLSGYMSSRFLLRCEARLVTDWVEVADPGDKANLQNASEFFRVGLDLGLTFHQPIPGAPGLIELAASYSARDDIGQSTTDPDGDADLFRAAISLLPGDESHFAFGVEYRMGENIASMEEQEQVLLQLRYRR